jgi:hypothetical protein
MFVPLAITGFIIAAGSRSYGFNCEILKRVQDDKFNLMYPLTLPLFTREGYRCHANSVNVGKAVASARLQTMYYQSFFTMSLSTYFCILPVEVLGSSVKTTVFGHLK